MKLTSRLFRSPSQLVTTWPGVTNLPHGFTQLDLPPRRQAQALATLNATQMLNPFTATSLRPLSTALALVLCAATVTLAQETSLDPKLLARIQEDDGILEIHDGTFYRIAESQNPGYVPYLLERQSHYVPDLLDEPVDMLGRSFDDYIDTLVRLDNVAGQQYLWCRSIVGSQTNEIVGMYRKFGGWFGIRALMAISEATEGDGGAYFASKGTWSLGEVARAELSAILHEAAIPIDFSLKSMTGVTPEEAAWQLRLRWREWVLAHEADLRLRKPQGQEVEMSTAGCDVKRRVPSPRFSFGIDWSPARSK